MKRHVLAMLVAVATMIGAGGAEAARIGVFDLQVEGGGTPLVYQLSNGNYLGLWGFDTRDRIRRGRGGIVTNGQNNRIFTGGTITTSDVSAGFGNSASRIVGYYYGRDSLLNNGASEFDPIVGPLALGAETRYFNSLWVEWTGGNLGFRSIAGTRTFGLNRAQVLPGDPFVTPVPLPAAGWMLLAAFGGLIALKRRKTA